MARYSFKLHDIGEGVAEAEVVAWHIKAGDRIDEDQAMLDVMTDKATVELSSPVAGVVTACLGAVGDRVPVGSSLVEIELDQADQPVEVAKAAEPVPVVVAAKPPPAVGNDAPLAAPATRKRAQEMGVARDQVTGTGPHGRITPEDLDRHVAAAQTDDAFTETKLSGLRRKIAERMEQSARQIPHFSYVEEFDLTALEELRAALNRDRGAAPKLTLLPFFMRALVRLTPRFPAVNSLYDEAAGTLRSYRALHIGIATQTEKGLTVPVVRNAEQLDLWDCARELARVTAAARDGSAKREELSGSTITLTSLGALGGVAATPVINHPEVAIIGPNKLVQRTAVLNGQIAIRTMMNVSSSFDHRIIDGFEAASFIQALKQLIENPAMIFIEGPAK